MSAKIQAVYSIRHIGTGRTYDGGELVGDPEWVDGELARGVR